VIFDIGGGSTEFTLVRDGAIVASASVRLGVVPLAERHPFPAAVERARYAAMSAEIGAQLRRELPRAIAEAGLAGLVGTAGTVTTLAALDIGLAVYDGARVQGHRLTRAAVSALRDRLAGLTLAERAALPCLEPGRADLIVPGVAIVEETMALVGLEILLVSDAGLREGLMADAVERLGV
jgi:exopolyphosphatase/guanosine-5'-triphosphate,3'-diphosphate pyrophosphatase